MEDESQNSSQSLSQRSEVQPNGIIGVKTKSKKSEAWIHFTIIVEQEGNTEVKYAKCNYCPK